MVMLYFKKKYLFFFLVIYILVTWGCVENRPMVIVENIDKLSLEKKKELTIPLIKELI